MIGVDRPGVGRSSPNTKGTLRAFAQDLKELLAELKIEKVRLLGLSGGAPYALAAAHDLGSVVEKVALVCPLGPLAVPEVFASMSEGMRKTFERHRQSPVLSKIIIKFWRFAFLLQPKACHRMLARTYSPVDQETLTNEELAGYIRNSFITAFEQGVDAVLMDATNYLSVWDFDLKDISVPITVWHGGQDVVVPPAVGRWYAKNLPNATLQLLDEHGHFSLPGLHQKAIFDDLLSKSITT